MAKERIRVVGTTGDADALNNGGGVVYAKPRGPYYGKSPTDPGVWVTRSGKGESIITWEWWEAPMSPSGAETEYSPDYIYTVYRAEVPLSVFEYYNWIDVDDVARGVGTDPDELRAVGASRAIMDRVYALETAVAYYGPHEFDQYPIQFSGTELKKRWARIWARHR